jgi:hypothetical protein
MFMLTGHKTRAVFERYNIVNEGDLQDAAAKLERADRQRGVSIGKIGAGRGNRTPTPARGTRF